MSVRRSGIPLVLQTATFTSEIHVGESYEMVWALLALLGFLLFCLRYHHVRRNYARFEYLKYTCRIDCQISTITPVPDYINAGSTIIFHSMVAFKNTMGFPFISYQSSS